MKKSLITLLVVTCAIAAHATKFYFNAPSTWTQPYLHVFGCGGGTDECFANTAMTQVPGIPNWYYIEVATFTTSYPTECKLQFNNNKWAVQLNDYVQTSTMPEYMVMGSNLVDLESNRGKALYLGGDGTSAPVFNKMTLYFQKPSSWANDAQTRVYIQTDNQGNAYVLCDEAMKAVPDADGWYYLEFYYLSDQTTNNYFQFRNGSTGDYTSALNAAFSSNGTLYLKSDGSTTSLAESTERPSVITYCGN